ncbi:toll/interleukin-1 receptor domain-containing protein [Caulobacter sp. NIBR2454]|uniref:toll/interleukin-1 receptor domain-containing protein n=1 Tax=Caulobacter sp. NIBR2454 TaxID=3015996 RepID=UPI0022B7005B|nr:toll/interleukin-1 receptor domain-containing protein [Caulobacter sp. NIBR2454]
MAKKTPDEMFLMRLEKMCAHSPSGRVSSNALEAALGWTRENAFSNARKRLIMRGLVRALPGGAGGLLECIKAPAPEPVAPSALKAFVSYCHADKDLKTNLLKHLEPLRRSGLIDHWHDGDIVVGSEWEHEIWSNFESADIILLLITIDFINSEYCYKKELAAAVERHKAKQARVIPVIGMNCLWEGLEFSNLHATLGGKAIASQPNQDDALTQVAREIKKAAEELRLERGSANAA